MNLQWMSPREVSRAVGVSERTVRRWISVGALPAQRVGPRLVRVLAADVPALIVPVVPRDE